MDDLEFFIIVVWLVILSLITLSLSLNLVRVSKEVKELKKATKD